MYTVTCCVFRNTRYWYRQKCIKFTHDYVNSIFLWLPHENAIQCSIVYMYINNAAKPQYQNGIDISKPCSVRSPVEVPSWSVDWQTFHSVLLAVWSWIRRHKRQQCEHTPSCIPPLSSCWQQPWVTEKWHIGHLRTLTWPAWISSCHKWTGLSLMLHWPAEWSPRHNSAGNRGASLLELFNSNS